MLEKFSGVSVNAQTHDDMLAVMEAKVENILQKFFLYQIHFTPVLASTPESCLFKVTICYVIESNND